MVVIKFTLSASKSFAVQKCLPLSLLHSISEVSIIVGHLLLFNVVMFVINHNSLFLRTPSKFSISPNFFLFSSFVFSLDFSMLVLSEFLINLWWKLLFQINLFYYHYSFCYLTKISSIEFPDVNLFFLAVSLLLISIQNSEYPLIYFLY